MVVKKGDDSVKLATAMRGSAEVSPSRADERTMVGMPHPSLTFSVRPAIAADVPAIHHLIEFHAQRGRMILRGFDELYSDLRSFMVAVEEGKVIGCASVHLFWSDLAELKCVAVEEARQRHGIGRAVVDACHNDLRRLGIKRAFTLTSATEFFEHLGYRLVAKDSLPRFIWGECVRCPSFPVCHEEALVFDLEVN